MKMVLLCYCGLLTAQTYKPSENLSAIMKKKIIQVTRKDGLIE